MATIFTDKITALRRHDRPDLKASFAPVKAGVKSALYAITTARRPANAAAADEEVPPGFAPVAIFARHSHSEADARDLEAWAHW